MQAARTRAKETDKVCYMHLVWTKNQVVLPNLLWFHFWKWIRLDFAWVVQPHQQQRIQREDIPRGLPREPALLHVEQVSPVTFDDEYNAEPFSVCASHMYW